MKTDAGSDSQRGGGAAGDSEDFWRVPSSAAGAGYVPLRKAESDGRWLDGQLVRKGDCIAYRGEACAQFLAGKHVKVLVDREHIYDAEKDLLAALMTVRQFSNDRKIIFEFVYHLGGEKGKNMLFLTTQQRCSIWRRIMTSGLVVRLVATTE